MGRAFTTDRLRYRGCGDAPQNVRGLDQSLALRVTWVRFVFHFLFTAVLALDPSADLLFAFPGHADVNNFICLAHLSVLSH